MLIAGDGAEGGIPAIGAAAGIAAPPIPIILSIMGIIISIIGIPIPPAGMGAEGIPAMGVFNATGKAIHTIGGWKKPEDFLKDLEAGKAAFAGQ